MAPRPEALMDELLEEIFLRIPPDDPARLLHAALVCRRWCRVVSDAGFRRRFREYHRTPPVLGFLRNYGTNASPFVSTSSFRTPPAVHTRAIDARHGRVLLQSRFPWEVAFHVWDPITGERRELPVLPPGPVSPWYWYWNAAVLCATDVCQHLDCHRGPFLIVFVVSGRGPTKSGTYAHVYSSEARVWGKQISAPRLDEDIQHIQLQPSALVENALYFLCTYSVLKYDLATRELSLIYLPEASLGCTMLMVSEYSGLGLAYICSRRLYLSSWKDDPDDGVGWTSKVIKLPALLPRHDRLGALGPMDPIGFAHGLDLLFVGTSVGIFTIDLKSMRVTKKCEEIGCDSLPYMSFCTPAAASAKGSRACKASAKGSRTCKSNA